MSFGERLIKFRKRKNWSQQTLADKSKVAVIQIKRYEKSQSQPTLEAIRKIAIALSVSSDELIFDEGMAQKKLNSKLLERFERVSQLSEKEIEVVETIIDSMLIRHQVNQMAQKDKG